jgi:hypothetical protein
MMAAFRSRMLGKSDAEITVIKASKEFQTSHSAQLNEAEWTPVLLAPLLFLAAKGVPAPIASSLAVAGSVIYPVARIFLGSAGTSEGAPLAREGALARVASLGMLAFAVYKATARTT